MSGARELAEALIARGVPREQALQAATEAALRAIAAKYPSGLASDDIAVSAAAEDNLDTLELLAARTKAAADYGVVKTVREAVTPWLWVTSLVGFALGLLNTRRIARMYSTWRDKYFSGSKPKSKGKR